MGNKITLAGIRVHQVMMVDTKQSGWNTGLLGILHLSDGEVFEHGGFWLKRLMSTKNLHAELVQNNDRNMEPMTLTTYHRLLLIG